MSFLGDRKAGICWVCMRVCALDILLGLVCEFFLFWGRRGRRRAVWFGLVKSARMLE